MKCDIWYTDTVTMSFMPDNLGSCSKSILSASVCDKYHRNITVTLIWLNSSLCLLIPQSHRPNRHETDLKSTKSSNSGRDRFTIGIHSVWCRFMVGQTHLSGRELSNMFERSLPDNLSAVCRLYVGVVSVMSGSVRGRIFSEIWSDTCITVYISNRTTSRYEAKELFISQVWKYSPFMISNIQIWQILTSFWYDSLWPCIPKSSIIV